MKLMISLYCFAGYHIVIICSNEEEEKSYFISKLHVYKRPYVFQTSSEDFQDYLIYHFTKQVQKTTKVSHDFSNMASAVDKMKYVIQLPLTCLYCWLVFVQFLCSCCHFLSLWDGEVTLYPILSWESWEKAPQLWSSSCHHPSTWSSGNSWYPTWAV